MPDENLEGAEQAADAGPEDTAVEAAAEEKDQKKAPDMVQMTQANFDKIVQAEKAKARRSALGELNVNEDWQEVIRERDELRSFRETQEEKESQQREEDMKKRGEFENLLVEQKQASATALQELKNQLDQEIGKYNKKVVDAALGKAFASSGGLKAALGVVQAAMRDTGVAFAVEENDEIVLKDQAGSRMTAGDGEFMTIDTFVVNFLRDNPYFTEAAQGQGSGAPTGLETPGVPLSAQEQSDYIEEQTAKGVDTVEIARKLGVSG